VYDLRCADEVLTPQRVAGDGLAGCRVWIAVKVMSVCVRFLESVRHYLALSGGGPLWAGRFRRVSRYARHHGIIGTHRGGAFSRLVLSIRRVVLGLVYATQACSHRRGMAVAGRRRLRHGAGTCFQAYAWCSRRGSQ